MLKRQSTSGTRFLKDSHTD
ncbi:hypothetical protein VCHC55A1_3047, partial [Vibrio cholerae HC-55A1]